MDSYISQRKYLNVWWINHLRQYLGNWSEISFNVLDSNKVLPALATKSWKTCWQTYTEWNVLTREEVEKTNTRLEEFILIMIKIYKNPLLFDPLQTAAMLAKVEELSWFNTVVFYQNKLLVKCQKNRTLLSKTKKISESESK